MNKQPMRAALAACAVALAVAGCGGGGGGGSGDDAASASEVPDSALRSVRGLIDYMEDVIATMTRDTTEPIVLGDVALPTSDTLEPL